MLVANEKPTGTNYTTTAALLILAFVFIPAVLIVSRPSGDASLSAAIACSLVCIALARINWTKFSQLSIASIADRRTSNK
jgi:uncharacterized membrane protein YhaH (DUF805 family)